MLISSKPEDSVCTPEDAVRICTAVIAAEHEFDRDKEHAFVFGLNSGNGIVFIDLVSVGILNAALVHPREVFRLAILKGCAAIIFLHNHPSGNLTPSSEDRKVAEQLKGAGSIIGISLLDSIIFDASGGYFSFKEKGFIV